MSSRSDPRWDYLHHLYHEKKMMFGRDRLYKFVQANRPDLVEQGLSRRFVMRFLQAQECHQLFKPVRRMKEIQSTVPLEPFNIVGMDLIDMHSMEFENYTYALTAIDLFTRKGYCVPLRSKSAEDVITWKGRGNLWSASIHACTHLPPYSGVALTLCLFTSAILSIVSLLSPLIWHHRH